MKLCAGLFCLLLVPAAVRCQQNPAPSAEPSSPPAAQSAANGAPELTLDEAIRLSMAKNPSIRTAILAAHVCPDRGIVRHHVHHAAPGPGALNHLRGRFENREMGRENLGA